MNKLYKFLNRHKEYEIKERRMLLSVSLIWIGVLIVPPLIAGINTKKAIILGITYVLLSLFYFIRTMMVFDKH